MIGVVIVAHGGLAAELLAATEHVLGRQDGMRAVPIGPEDDRSAKIAEIAEAIRSVDHGDGVAVVTDMFGGSPANLSLLACEGPGRQVLSGANLPMLVKLTRMRSAPLSQAVHAAHSAGLKYMGLHRPATDEKGASHG